MEVSAFVFHFKCNNQGATLTVVKSFTNHLFGSYTPIPGLQVVSESLIITVSFLHLLTT